MTSYLKGKYPSVQDIDASIEECERFVNEFRVGNSLYYIDQLQSIANRERVLFEIDLEHIQEHSEDLNLKIRYLLIYFSRLLFYLLTYLLIY